MLKDYNAMNLINTYILPHYESDVEYTKIINDIIKKYPTLEFIKFKKF